MSLPNGRVFLRLAGQYVEFLASEIWAGLVELATIPETIAGVDTARAVTPAGLAAAINAAISKIINGSPAAMDTLRELADALGNDANFAASVTNTLAGKVDLTHTATETRMGIVELATILEAIAGKDTERAVTPAGLAATLASVTPLRPNLCPNGGLEDGIGNIVVTKSGSGVWPSAISVNSWGNSIYLTGTKTDGTYLITWPTFPVDSGVTYVISGDAALLSSSGTVRYQIQWINASGAVISTSPGPSRGPADFADGNTRLQAMAAAVVAPANTVKAQLQCVFDTLVGATAIFARRAKVERGSLPATAYTPPTPTVHRAMHVYNTAGTYTFTAPVTGWYWVDVYGAGGGGGKAPNGNWGDPGGGGGYTCDWIYHVAGTVVTITVGAKGVSSTTGAGTTGGTSSYGSYLSATGGIGGNVVTDTPGLGGSGIGGKLNLIGQSGRDGASTFQDLFPPGGDAAGPFGGKGASNPYGATWPGGGGAVGYNNNMLSVPAADGGVIISY